METPIEKQLEQLQNNINAVKQVEQRYEAIQNSPYYTLFKSESERKEALRKNRNLHKRLLDMRMSLIYKIGGETLLEIKSLGVKSKYSLTNN